MSNNNFSRRRRGMRFRPKGGLGQNQQKPDREAVQARAEVVTEQGGVERVFEKRHAHEIERAENLAAGLPPQGAVETPAREAEAPRPPQAKAPAPAPEEKTFAPVPVAEPSKGILDSIRNVATTLAKKVRQFIR